MIRSLRALAVLLVAPFMGMQQATAFEPELPLGARLTAERETSFDSFDAPVAAFDGTIVPSISLEGEITRRAWRINSPGLTPLQVMVPLRAQLEAQGYELVFECAAAICGGFDFRFGTEVLPGPNMYVNISRFRYLTALLGGAQAPSEAIGVLVSVTAESAYVQVISADTQVELRPVETTAVDVKEPVSDAAEPRPGLETALLENGHVILSDLDFATGTSDLGPGPFASLAQLADLLRERDDLRIALVGHTDTVGGLETNTTISRARARSVRERLIAEFKIDAARLDAEGMGYLAPIATNQTEQGRTLNRRVEAVLLNGGS